MRELAEYVEGLVEGRRGFLVQQKRGRQVYSFPGEPPDTTHWVKRGWGRKACEIRRETENARTLERMGLGPAVAASGRFGDSEWLVLEHLHFQFALEPPVARRRDLAAVAAAVRKLHGEGFAFPDLERRHVFVRDGVKLIDSARLSRHRGGAPVGLRARDLAAFLFSLGPLATRRVERVRFVTEATGAIGATLRDILRRVDARIVVLSRRTRWRRRWNSMSEEAERELLPRFPWGRSEQVRPRPSWPTFVWHPASSDLVRKLPDRENRVFGDAGPGRQRFFVKRFPPGRRPWSPAMSEFAAVDVFRRGGILVNHVALLAEDLERGSVIAVRACRGEPLDDLLRRGVTVTERRALAVQTARIWRRMRECGLRHRDAYPCHLFVSPWTDAGAESRSRAGADRPSPRGAASAPRFELRLIDLTRAGLAPFPKERWFVKDAAQLWHGCPRPPVTRTDAVRWLREYFRVPKLTRAAKRFARKVAAKERSIAAHVARKTRRAGKSS